MKAYHTSLVDEDAGPFEVTGEDEPRLLDAYAIGDLHLGHVRLEIGGPLGGIRPAGFTELLVSNWNAMVPPDALALVLGDVIVGWPRDEWKNVPYLAGVVGLVPGNHESRAKIELLRGRGWRILRPITLVYRDWLVTLSHEPVPIDDLLPNQLSVHGHIHHNPEPTERHLNLSAEQLDYRPQPLRRLLDQRIDTLNR